MAGIEPLISINELKVTKLKEFFASKKQPPLVHYDDDFDAFTILIAPICTLTAVYPVDDQVGLLYQADTLEIVGLQIEAFEHSFIPQRASVRKVWRLSDACEDLSLEDVGDMILAVEKRTSEVVREVARATEPILQENAAPVARALEPILA